MSRRTRKAWALFVSGMLAFILALPAMAMDCRSEYERRIHHIETVLEQERREVRRDRERLQRAYRDHRGGRERKEELRRELEREKAKLQRLERHMREKRLEAKRQLRECQEQNRRSYR